MSMYSLIKANPTPSVHDVEEAFDGNLCRCTGYRPILKGAKSFAVDCSEPCSTNGKCSHPSSQCSRDIEDLASAVRAKEQSVTLAFPQELQNDVCESYYFDDGITKWYHPSSLGEFLEIMGKHPSAKIINGNTEVGIETQFKAASYGVFVSPIDIEELKQIYVSGIHTIILYYYRQDAGFHFGSCLTLASFQSQLHSLIKQHPESKTRGLKALIVKKFTT